MTPTANPAGSTGDVFRVLVVGDVHGHWSEADSRILEDGNQDLALFVGDIADEDPDVVRSIAELDCELGVILGNHDAWQSFTNKRIGNRLRCSLDLLGEDHLAYSIRDLPAAGLSLVGGRPFSWGGRDLRSPEIYRELYGVETPEDSAERIVEAAARARFEDVVIVAHNGPRGLGSRPGDIYGKDFGRNPGGDWGDRDLAWAIRDIQQGGRRVRAVIAGHMHDRLTIPRGALRRRFVRRGGIDYVNPAVVPRRRRADDGSVLSHFVELCFADRVLRSCRELWLDASGTCRKAVPIEFAELTRES